MIVFTVHEKYEDATLGIFSTRKKAELYIQQIKDEFLPEDSDYYIIEQEVDSKLK